MIGDVTLHSHLSDCYPSFWREPYVHPQLDRDRVKALLLKHITESGNRGVTIDELEQVAPSLSRRHLQRLLADLYRTFVPWDRADSIGKTDRSVLEVLVIVQARRLEAQPDTAGRNQRRC